MSSSLSSASGPGEISSALPSRYFTGLQGRVIAGYLSAGVEVLAWRDGVRGHVDRARRNGSSDLMCVFAGAVCEARTVSAATGAGREPHPA